MAFGFVEFSFFFPAACLSPTPLFVVAAAAVAVFFVFSEKMTHLHIYR